MYKYIFSLCLTLVFICGCSSKTPVIEPAWINKPNLHGKIGAVGSSKPQFKGKTHQRRVAISRALDELAQQSGVNIDTRTARRDRRIGSQGRSSTEVFTLQTSNNKTVQAHIEEIWTDPRTKEMYIWLVVD